MGGLGTSLKFNYTGGGVTNNFILSGGMAMKFNYRQRGEVKKMSRTPPPIIVNEIALT